MSEGRKLRLDGGGLVEVHAEPGERSAGFGFYADQEPQPRRFWTNPHERRGDRIRHIYDAERPGQHMKLAPDVDVRRAIQELESDGSSREWFGREYHFAASSWMPNVGGPELGAFVWDWDPRDNEGWWTWDPKRLPMNGRIRLLEGAIAKYLRSSIWKVNHFEVTSMKAGVEATIEWKNPDWSEARWRSAGFFGTGFRRRAKIILKVDPKDGGSIISTSWT